MSPHTSRGVWQAARSTFGPGTVSAVFFLLMLAFVLGNAVIVHSLLSRYDGALGQAMTLDHMRASSQQLAVRAMRLSDGALVQAGQISQDMDFMDRAMQALDQGGVIDGREIPALTHASVRDFLPRIRRDWAILRGRLQTALLGTYVRDEQASETQSLPQVIQRQWVADDAETLLATLDACADTLMPLLLQGKDHALLMSGGLVLFDLIVLLGLYLLLRRHLVRPLRELRIACRELVRGHYDVRVAYRGSGVFGQVVQDFNDGIRQVHDLLAKMRENQAGLLRADTIFQGLASNSIVGIFLVEQDRFTFVSHKMAEIFGYEPHEMIDAMTLLGIVVPRERFLMAESIKASQNRRDGTLRFERRGRRKDGTEIDIEVFSSTVKMGEQVSIIGIVQDITERKQAESSAQLAAIAYENSSEAIAITDSAGVVIDVNPAYSRMTGFWPDEIAGELLPLLRPGRHNRDFYDDMWHAINTQGRWEGEYWGQRKSGESYAERVVMDTAWNHDGSINCRVAMLSDVTQKKQIETQIWNQAHHDPLTGLPNRQYFNERLRAAVQSADRSGQSLALLFLDLDLFKEINDSMGHATGDRLLIEVARRLQACAPPDGSFVARLGGDEFVILLSNASDKAHIDDLCRAILDRITQSYRLGGDPLRVSASLGVALYPQDAEDAEALMRHVDMAMYVAKASGRNCYHYFDQSMRERARMQRDLMYALPQAIEDSQFFLLFQPIHAFQSGRIVQAEVLLRWRHPEFGVISPADFIAFAEERQLIRPLGDWVFREAIHQLARWRQDLAPDLRLTINVSPAQLGLGDDTGLDAVFGLFDTLGLPPDCLVLELSEQVLVAEDPQMRIRLRGLHDAGLRFSVGAVSIGMPALLAVHEVPFETLRLDRATTERLLDGQHAAMVCEALIALAHRLGLRVTAEGIASQIQYELLRDAGCDEGQGYWFDEPLDQAAFEQRLRDEAGHRAVH
ncbi:MAG: EAL domain-containing protein [Castellaniella sp.]|uniref:putative bifunctional diguanylate cyclase/phosphodiesterase n=1 Tax=Castellaniella sp. TaxID=1955812 RepID=UPI002A369416|nr:EAL domain-containing protein [Castellaniella sp.]MDY0309652.1 EAL domain-containing protein [Castellaniella sp.]